MIVGIGRRVAVGRELVRVFGPGWVAYRAGYALQQRSGWLERRWPATAWDDASGAALSDSVPADPARYLDYRRNSPIRFFFDPQDRTVVSPLLRAWDGATEGPRAAADGVLQGKFRYFSGATHDLGFPPDWHVNPLSGTRAPEDLHWSRIGEYRYGDVKVLWEPSRFSFTYDLMRAYWRTGDEAYAEGFWRLVEDWRRHNPPSRGVNWRCGQEASFRVMAWCFGLYGLFGAEATTPERVAMLARMVALSGQRIERNLRYALSQRNNHGVSEAAGLWTIGLLFPELRRSSRWRELGARYLEALGRDLIYDDGTFVQHSTNYHRLMLQTYIWAIRLGDLNGYPFTSVLRSRLSRAVNVLFQLQDERTGAAPFYGHNDGALLLPLNNCDYHDLRPVVQAASLLCDGVRRYETGPWDEDLLWLFGPGAGETPVARSRRIDFAAPDGGLYTLRSQQGFAVVRCPSFRDRPGQADALHVDLWWQGQNVALDAGTYSYHADPPADIDLSRTAAHNTVTVDGLDQMNRVGRFLWLPWLTSRVRAHTRSEGGSIAYWEGEHDGYTRLPDPVVHRRAVIQLPDERVVVLDALQGDDTHVCRLHWLLPDLPYRWDAERGSVCLETPAGPYGVQLGGHGPDRALSLVRAADDARGWRSERYLQRTPALSVALSSQGRDVRFWSVLGPPCTVSVPDDMRLRIEYDGVRADLTLASLSAPSLVRSVECWGPRHDVLDL